MNARDRTADLDKLADAVIGGMEHEEDEGIHLPAERPFGYSGRCGIAASILDDILEDTEPEGKEGREAVWSDEQYDYATDLYHSVLSHIKDRWRQFRAKEDTPC